MLVLFLHCSYFLNAAQLCVAHLSLIKIEINNVKKERYLISQDNTIYKYSIKKKNSSIGQDKSKLQKQISILLILIATAVLIEMNK